MGENDLVMDIFMTFSNGRYFSPCARLDVRRSCSCYLLPRPPGEDLKGTLQSRSHSTHHSGTAPAVARPIRTGRGGKDDDDDEDFSWFSPTLYI